MLGKKNKSADKSCRTSARESYCTTPYCLVWLGVSTSKARRRIPVSYTHLDVYKRQT